MSISDLDGIMALSTKIRERGTKMDETRTLIDKVIKQYNIYTEAIKPYSYTLTDVSIIDKKATQIYIQLVKDYLISNSIHFDEVSSGRLFLNYENTPLEIFINCGNCAIMDREYNRTYFCQTNLEIANIFYGYSIVFINSLDPRGKTLEQMYNLTRGGQLSNVQMEEFLEIMQKNLKTLNKELPYLETHNSYNDYDFELVDTVYRDENDEFIKYEDFDAIWNKVISKIEK